MRTRRALLVLSCLLVARAAGGMAQGNPPKDTATSPQPQPAAAPAPDLYAFSYSEGTYANAFFGFSLAIPTGYRMAEIEDLKKADDERSAQEMDAHAKQNRNMADLIKRGLIHVARSYVMMAAGDSSGAVIVTEARERTAPNWATPGSCGAFYYQEAGPGPKDKALGKAAKVEYGGTTIRANGLQDRRSGSALLREDPGGLHG